MRSYRPYVGTYHWQYSTESQVIMLLFSPAGCGWNKLPGADPPAAHPTYMEEHISLLARCSTTVTPDYILLLTSDMRSAGATPKRAPAGSSASSNEPSQQPSTPPSGSATPKRTPTRRAADKVARINYMAERSGVAAALSLSSPNNGRKRSSGEQTGRQAPRPKRTAHEGEGEVSPTGKKKGEKGGKKRQANENFVRLRILFFLTRRQTFEGRSRYANFRHRE